MILKLKSSCDEWTYIDHITKIQINKGYANEDCDSTTAEEIEKENPTLFTIGNTSTGIEITISKDDRHIGRIITSLPTYLLNDNGQTIEKL